MITPIPNPETGSMPSDIVAMIRQLVNDINQRVAEIERRIKKLEAA